MAFTYNPATDEGKVRLLIADTVEFMPDGVTRLYAFEDEEISAFLEMAGGSINLGAAKALRSLAANGVKLE